MPRKPAQPSPNGQGPLMEDVAKLAGVAISTVSRALANPGRVNEETRKRIAKAAKTLGYTPNATARNLRLGKSRTVMVITTGSLMSNVSQIVPGVIHAIYKELLNHGHLMMIATVDGDPRTVDQVVEMAFSGVVCGAILLNSLPLSSKGYHLTDTPISVVSLLSDESPAGIPSVITNDAEIMAQACDHLLQLGHRRILYVGGPAENYHDIQRRKGISAALEAAGLTPGMALSVLHLGYDFTSGSRTGALAAEAIQAMAVRPTAVLCFSDDIAVALIAELRRRAIQVPQDISVIGFDDSAIADYVFPPLTTINQPTNDLGAAAVRLLLDRLRGDDALPATVVVDSRLIVRESTAGPKPQSKGNGD
jgi:DNA-binding LacI/PurR family transcriptional regulator